MIETTTNQTLQPSTDATDSAEGIAFSGSVWFQERYFLAVLQQEIERTREAGLSLAVVLVRVPEYTRRAAHELFAYAEAAKGSCFYGLLSNGDYVVCMPGSDYSKAALQRTRLSHALAEFNATLGLSVLDEEATAAELLVVAEPGQPFAGPGADPAQSHKTNMVRPPCLGLLRRDR